MKCLLLLLVLMLSCDAQGLFFSQKNIRNLLNSGALDLNVLRCYLRNKNICPNPYLEHRLYTPKSARQGVLLNIHNPLMLYKAGFNGQRETALVIHGFNGSASDTHIQFLKDAYLSRDFNVITVDWRPLTRYPCYINALINTRLTAQCTAQIYSFLTHYGAQREKITCVGHSLGAHICGMISNHLTMKQYRIIGLDPARPLIERLKSSRFRLTIDDATVIQILHTNAGILGQEDNTGHLNYCLNGGRLQPHCKGRSRCSHFLSICYLANAMFKHKKFSGVPCPNGCMGNSLSPISINNVFAHRTLGNHYYIGNDAPDDLQGCFCINVPYVKHCPYTD